MYRKLESQQVTTQLSSLQAPYNLYFHWIRNVKVITKLEIKRDRPQELKNNRMPAFIQQFSFHSKQEEFNQSHSESKWHTSGSVTDKKWTLPPVEIEITLLS